MLVIDGSTTASTAAAVTTASMALPPSWITWSPAAEASGWLQARTPRVAKTGDRVPWLLPTGRSPAREWTTSADAQACYSPPGGAPAPALAPTAMSWPFGSLTERPFATGIPFFAL